MMCKKNFYVGSFAFVLSICGFMAQNLGAADMAQYKAIFAHGLGGNKDFGKYYGPLMGCPIISENGPEWDKSKYGRNIGPAKSCLAQQGDIDVVVKQIEANSSKNLILFGVSKGAATVLNTVGYLAENKPEDLKNIKAVIADAPFAKPENVAAKMVGMFTGEFIGNGLAGGFWGRVGAKACYPNYEITGITPYKAVTKMWANPAVDRNMVVTLIHGKGDELISINDSRLLYIELKKLGYKNVYLLEVSRYMMHGQACFYGFGHMYGNWDIDVYPGVFSRLCSIYAKHNLPLPVLSKMSDRLTMDGSGRKRDAVYKQTYEQFCKAADAAGNISPAGQKLLDEMLPTIAEVEKRINPGTSDK